MTDKVQKIREEIERLKKNWQLGRSSEAKYRVEMLEEISYLIDSMQEEPVSEDLEKVADQYSESVESDYSNDMFDSHNIFEAVIYGAKWQKQQMMKDAVEAIVQTNSMSGNTVVVHLDCKYKAGDKVKLIIIKEG